MIVPKALGIIPAFIYKTPAMYTYTMTFVDQKELALTPASQDNSTIHNIVLKKFKVREFILADFNWFGNYDPAHSGDYLKEPYLFNAVVEIRLPLDVALVASRDEIYDRCIAALEQGELAIQQSEMSVSAGPRKSLIRMA